MLVKRLLTLARMLEKKVWIWERKVLRKALRLARRLAKPSKRKSNLTKNLNEYRQALIVFFFINVYLKKKKADVSLLLHLACHLF